MSIIAKNNGGGLSFDPVPAGSYPARCYSMIQIGTILENVMGVEKKMHKVRISWELPTELKVFKEEKGEQPYSLSKEFTLSMHEKATLRKFLESWRGKSFSEQEAEAFDITNLIGKPCMMSVKHKEAKNGNTYAEIAGVNLMPKGMECPPQINQNQILSFDDWNEDLFQSLPDFIKDKIKLSDEYNSMMWPSVTHANKEAGEDDDLPF